MNKSKVRALQRFFFLTKRTGSCISWTGKCVDNHYLKYGIFIYEKREVLAHRWLYQVAAGKRLGRWQFVCHKCDNSLCVNLDHLYLGDHKSNMRDVVVRKRQNGRSLPFSCKNGHKRTPENTKLIKNKNPNKEPVRQCKICLRVTANRAYWRYRKKQALAALGKDEVL